MSAWQASRASFSSSAGLGEQPPVHPALATPAPPAPDHAAAATPPAAAAGPARVKPHSQAANLDALVLLTIMASMSFGALQFRDITPPAAIPGFAITLALTLPVAAWAWRGGDGYQRWRAPLVALCRLVITAAPLAHFCVITAGGRLALLRSLDAALGPAASQALFTAGLLFAGQSVRLAVVGLGLPLRGVAHAALQLVCLAIVASKNGDMCEVILHTGGAAAADPRGGMLQHLIYARPLAAPPANPAATPLAAEMLGSVYFTFSTLPMLLPHPLLLPAVAASPAAQCRCVLGMLQASIGLLMPVMVHWWLESQQAHKQLAAGGAEGAQQPGAGGWLGRGFYRGLFAAGQLAEGRWLGLWLLAELLCTTWVVVAALV